MLVRREVSVCTKQHNTERRGQASVHRVTFKARKPSIQEIKTRTSDLSSGGTRYANKVRVKLLESVKKHLEYKIHFLP